MKNRLQVLIFLISFFSLKIFAADLKIGDLAPSFSLKTHENKDFKLEERKGKWTVLYFYPKAETPGCTKQACAFRDSIKVIRELDADVFGVSADSVEDIAKFHQHHKLNFMLLADPDSKVITSFGAKMPMVKMSKRWTFILDPNLKISSIDTDVDPVKDADKTAAKIKELKKTFK